MYGIWLLNNNNKKNKYLIMASRVLIFPEEYLTGEACSRNAVVCLVSGVWWCNLEIKKSQQTSTKARRQVVVQWSTNSWTYVRRMHSVVQLGPIRFCQTQRQNKKVRFECWTNWWGRQIYARWRTCFWIRGWKETKSKRIAVNPKSKTRKKLKHTYKYHNTYLKSC